MIYLAGLLVTLCCTFVQALLVACLVRVLHHPRLAGLKGRGLFFDTALICGSVAALFAGMVVQVAIWALLFYLSANVPEIPSFSRALYFSFVNFTSLGYGDITLSDETAILGPIEAANGIIQLGLSTSFLLALVNSLYLKRKEIT